MRNILYSDSFVECWTTHVLFIQFVYHKLGMFAVIDFVEALKKKIRNKATGHRVHTHDFHLQSILAMDIFNKMERFK